MALMLTILWIILGLVAVVVALAALGIFGIYIAYTSGDEFVREKLEKKHGLWDDDQVRYF